MARIVITGAAGFIGSCLLKHFQKEEGHTIIAVDNFQIPQKKANYQYAENVTFIDRNDFFSWFIDHGHTIDLCLHIGARTDTTEQDLGILSELNTHYSQFIWEACVSFAIPLIYASSAATYGDGILGYQDDHSVIKKLKPLNPYGQSKQDFDVWALEQPLSPPFWAGLKFFNVYGPNEYHKGRMASVVYHTYQQILKTGRMNLFRSHRSDVDDGFQSRDFIYVKDVISVISYLARTQPASGIYNLGSGIANPFLHLAQYTFEAMNRVPDISFVDTPEDIRDTYQYYTCANMEKLLDTGYKQPFYSLKEGVFDYVQGYLMHERPF
jgi:ADP-L-glycero-D-manno-heptose 6-epimerase